MGVGNRERNDRVLGAGRGEWENGEGLQIRITRKEQGEQHRLWWFEGSWSPCLSTWSPVSSNVWEGLGSVAVLEEACQRDKGTSSEVSDGRCHFYCALCLPVEM